MARLSLIIGLLSRFLFRFVDLGRLYLHNWLLMGELILTATDKPPACSQWLQLGYNGVHRLILERVLKLEPHKSLLYLFIIDASQRYFLKHIMARCCGLFLTVLIALQVAQDLLNTLFLQ